ncbi:hypothetical protein D6C97_08673 [Aureobasidium pullulans]|uniref:Uncharacterized protein n=1 Tax=Aureobasidium pullulans TaxID=5580 RepID=A0A4S9MQG5_AURPU|nr:hypothetical protein D6D29_05510 [Aureobasidium pullulans]THW10325.1 hypothetical protein D6D24_08043 [Aureobasidium pullulans]THW88364.1 hypothetical protein D6D18_07135 [Aureobasidium pullulans]THY45270.1 hypothetical protein D6C97_08673 [Aureobasidium pullulans]THY75415.1 hypothetical protein D6C94_04121 [Aureobasidium pullulans]
MPSSSDHDTAKERSVMYTYLRADVRLHHASQDHMRFHLLAAFSAILEMEETDLEYTLEDNVGHELVLKEEDQIMSWRDGSKSALVQSAAEIVEDCARDVAGAFGVDQQRVLFELANHMFGAAREMKSYVVLDVITLD